VARVARVWCQQLISLCRADSHDKSEGFGSNAWLGIIS